MTTTMTTTNTNKQERYYSMVAKMARRLEWLMEEDAKHKQEREYATINADIRFILSEVKKFDNGTDCRISNIDVRHGKNKQGAVYFNVSFRYTYKEDDDAVDRDIYLRHVLKKTLVVRLHHNIDIAHTSAHDQIHLDRAKKAYDGLFNKQLHTECNICRMEDDNCFTLKNCNHTYHKECMLEWLKMCTSGFKCPICQKPIE
jgi:hypothetical protein